jgi:hypothetical protein
LGNMSFGSHNEDEIKGVSGKRTRIGLILIGLSGVYPYVIVVWFRKGRWFVPSVIINLNLNRVFSSRLDRVGVYSADNFSWGGRREKRENFPVVAVA